MSGKVAEIQGVYSEDDLAKSISTQWDNYKSQRHGWEQERLELRNYLFATDTTTTTNSKLPWKNKTYLTLLHTHHPYSTVLAQFDEDGRFYRISQPLYFGGEKRYIEFPSGLAIDKDNVYFGLGLDDRVSTLRSLPKKEVDSLLTIKI